MKKLLSLLITAFCFSSAAGPEKAKVLYDEGNFTQSAATYRTLTRAGHSSPELFFNLGNALFRSGNLPEAVASYRRAWRLAPSDPDIAANLQYALREAGAELPQLSAIDRFLLQYSATRWYLILISSSFAAMLLFGAAVVLRAIRRPFLFLAVILLAVAGTAVAGSLRWKTFDSKPEAVTLEKTDVHFAPLENSTVHFSLPKAALTRITKTSGLWSQINLNGKRGWVKNEILYTIKETN